MIYLVSTVAGRHVETVQRKGDGNIGVMMTPASGVRTALAEAYGVWGADNGCFAQGDAFRLDKYLEWLQAMAPVSDRCLFATAPDVVGDPHRTLERSRDVLPMLRHLGYPPAFVAQDGAWDTLVPWDGFDVLFIGGTDSRIAGKLSSEMERLAREAKGRGKWVHMGRVNSRRRILIARRWDCDSVDGTHVAFAPDRKLRQLFEWMGEATAQSVMAL